MHALAAGEPDWAQPPLGDGRRLVFVGGPPRSGTTLVQNVLDSHPGILGTPELLHLPDLFRVRKAFLGSVDRGFLEFFCEHDDVDRATYGFLTRMLGPVLESRDEHYVSEKTPGNVLVFSDIGDLLPRARFIFVVRDPRAIVWSMQRVGARARDLPMPAFVSDVREAVRTVSRHLGAGFEFADREPDRCLTIRFEDLTTRPEEVTRDVCDFLDLEWSESMLYPGRYTHPGEAALTREGLWYDRAEFRRAISPERNELWREELPERWQILVTRAFRGHGGLADAGYRIDLDHLKGLRALAGRMAWGGTAVLRRARRRMAPS